MQGEKKGQLPCVMKAQWFKKQQCVREGRKGGWGMGWQISLARPGVTKNYPDPIDHVKGYYRGMKKFFWGDRMYFFCSFSKALLFCCSLLASVKCWNVCRDALKSCTMSIKFAEQYIFLEYVWPFLFVISWASHQVILLGCWLCGAGPQQQDCRNCRFLGPLPTSG